MDSLIVTLVGALFFFALSPGLFLRVPKTSSIFTAAGIHAVAFACILYFTNEFAWHFSESLVGTASLGNKKSKKEKGKRHKRH